MTPSASAKALRRDQSGATAVEFAMIAPLLLTMIMGILALGIAYYQGATVQWSMERTLRTAMVHPDMDESDIEQMLAEAIAGVASIDDINFTYNIDDSGEVPLAIARAEYAVPLHIPFIPEISLRFEAENVMPAPEASS